MNRGKLVAAKLRAAREKAGLTQEAVAKKAKMARVAYVRIESGKHEPTIKTLCRIAPHLGVNAKDLI